MEVYVEVAKQFVMEDRTYFFFVLLERVNPLGVNHVSWIFNEAPCCFGGAAICNKSHG